MAMSLSATVIDGTNILMIGGFNGSNHLDTVYKYDRTGNWELSDRVKLHEGHSSFPAFRIKETSLKDCPLGK